MKLINSLAVLALIAAAAAPALADDTATGKSAGDILFRVRGIGIIPEPTSSISVIGGHVAASNTIEPEVDGSYFFTDNIAVELIAATTRHHMTAKDTILGNVDVGMVRLLPPTVTLQWHFMPESAFSPYVGAGLNYTFFFDHSVPGKPVSRISYDNNFGEALQIGADYNISGRWFLNFDVKQIFLNTTAKINGGVIRANTDLNPTLIGIGIGYRL